MADEDLKAQPPGGGAVGAPAAPAEAAPAKKRGRRLSSMANIKAALADVYRQLEAGTLKAGDARARIYALQVLAQVIQVNDLEKQLARLDAAVREAGGAAALGAAAPTYARLLERHERTVPGERVE